MEKEQLELFSGSENNGGGSGGATKVSGAFLQYLRAYEKTILIIILLLAVSVLSFIAGVEKGKNSVLKHLAALRQQQETAAPAQPQPARQALPAAQSRPTAALQRPAQQPTAVVSQQAAQAAPAPRITGKYTVQLASYKSKEQALKEAQALQKRGLAPAVIYLRPYYVLCSGSFQESRTAELWRLKFKKQYRDCYVRRL